MAVCAELKISILTIIQGNSSKTIIAISLVYAWILTRIFRCKAQIAHLGTSLYFSKWASADKKTFWEQGSFANPIKK